MKTIVYKKLFNKYRITQIREALRPEITLKFEEPIEAKLFINNAVFTVTRGSVEIPQAALCEGKICPNLYTGAGKEDIEGFSLSHGEVIRATPDSEYLIALGYALEQISERVGECESTLSEIKGRLDQKLKF